MLLIIHVGRMNNERAGSFAKILNGRERGITIIIGRCFETLPRESLVTTPVNLC